MLGPPALRPVNCESDFAISASRAIEEPVITADPLDQLGRSQGRYRYGAGTLRLNHPHQDLVRSIGVCPASPPIP